jgi:DNA topoisomerase 2-associated protein PAT1
VSSFLISVLSLASNANSRFLASYHGLQGALGKTSGRSYKAAPRQLLQVDTSNTATHLHISKEDAIRTHGEGAAKEAAKIGVEALGVTADVRR